MFHETKCVRNQKTARIMTQISTCMTGDRHRTKQGDNETNYAYFFPGPVHKNATLQFQN